ncbi:MAG: patatin-like phospholipase family protein, partial [Christensenellales bacterium]
MSELVKTRKTLGLALGAGSAKGFAHIGFLQVLEEEGIPVDFVCGSSMGAVVGAIYCCGTDLKLAGQMIPMLNEKELFDFRLPRKGGFIKGEKFQALVRLLTKDKSFEETKIPFSCVAVDLYTGRLVVLSEGK